LMTLRFVQGLAMKSKLFKSLASLKSLVSLFLFCY
jgi:hypothetical protein